MKRKTPRESIRRAFEAEFLSEEDAEILLDAFDKRNLLSHTYDEGTAEKAVRLIKGDYTPILIRLRQTLQTKKSE